MKTIALTQGYEAMIDDEDYDKVIMYKWSTVISPYTTYGKRALRRTYDGVPRKYQFLHHFILPLKDNLTVDHIDRNGLNCQKANLRYATPSQQMMNRVSLRPYGYCGIKPATAKGRWKSRLIINRIEYTKTFDTKEEAARHYDELAKKHFGEFAVLNFPGG